MMTPNRISKRSLVENRSTDIALLLIVSYLFSTDELSEQFPFQILLTLYANDFFVSDKKSLNYRPVHETDDLLKLSFCRHTEMGCFSAQNIPLLRIFTQETHLVVLRDWALARKPRLIGKEPYL